MAMINRTACSKVTGPGLSSSPAARSAARLRLQAHVASSRRDLLASTTTLTLGLCTAQMAVLPPPQEVGALDPDGSMRPSSPHDGAVGRRPAWGSALAADDFITTPSGLRYYDIKIGSGPSPSPGNTVAVHWSGYTKGYQGKRIDNTSVRDEPYEFKLGAKQAIPAFEEAVSGMMPGGIRRVEVSGEIPGLSYPRNRTERFTDDLISQDLKIFKYRYGPQPAELGGQRALDFVLDNSTLPDFNRTLLFDIKLLTVRK